MSDLIHDNKLQILGKLAASLTHEIKNPLSVLKLNLEYLKMNPEKFDKETNECIDASIEAAEIINQLIYNTLDFSRKNKDNYDISNLNNIIEKAINITRGIAAKKNIQFDLLFDENLDDLKVNETNILQVFVNIISNGIEASVNNSKIIIQTYHENGKICATVIDEGVGIEDDVKDKIFEEFYTDKDGGTGLGLSVCKSILDEHEAEILVCNNHNKGAQFTIQFKR